jgi:hypothetical protein
MAEKTLLDFEVNKGLEFIRKLDEDGYDIQSALWLYQEDAERWKLLLYSPEFKKETGSEEYGKLFQELQLVSPNGELPFESLRLVYHNDRFLDAIKCMTTVKGLSTVRVSSGMLNGIYVNDALIYRNDIH